MKRMIFLFALLSVCLAENPYDPADLRATVKPISYYENLEKNVIEKALSALPGNEIWNSAFWAMEICDYRSPKMRQKLKNMYSALDSLPASFLRSYWEAVKTCYPKHFQDEALDFMTKTDNPKLFAMAAYYLKNEKARGKHEAVIKSQLHVRFSPEEIRKNPILTMLNFEFSDSLRPPLEDLLSADFGDLPVIFCFFRENRDYPGRSAIRLTDKSWLRHDNGDLVTTAILGRAMSDFPGTITNGNTPQGIFSIRGIGFSDNIFIGPAPTIQTGLPFEYDRSDYFHQKSADDTASWNISDYADLLPESWRHYYPIYEAWYAGSAGRSDIIIHGSTILPELYLGKCYFPLTPSLGCITSREKWLPCGKNHESEQIRLVNAFLSTGFTKGFCVVVNIDDLNRPVRSHHLKKLIK